jgi:hypothetical protein
MDGALAAIVERCLEIDPTRRFHDAGAVLEALDRRERGRRRRPVLVCGLLAPLLILLAMTGLAWWTGRQEIAGASEQLAQQLQESDRVGARLVANVVQDNLCDRIELLENFRDERRRELLCLREGRAASGALVDLLRELHERGKPHPLFSQYAIADRDGYILAGYPFRAEQLVDEKRGPRRYAYRDWFNGTGDKRDRMWDGFEPIRRPHVSQPYVSRLPGEKRLCVNVSVPLREAKGGPVVGVLTGQIRVAELHSWLEGVEMPGACVALFNERGHCLKHRESSATHPPQDADPVDWRQRSAALAEILGPSPGDGLARYDDPVTGVACLAGYAPFPRHEGKPVLAWVALMQHDRKLALRPVADLERNLLFNCGLVLVVGGLLATGLWGWLVLTLRREERSATGAQKA